MEYEGFSYKIPKPTSKQVKQLKPKNFETLAYATPPLQRKQYDRRGSDMSTGSEP